MLLASAPLPRESFDADTPEMSSAEHDAYFRRLIRDSTAPPGLRWEMATNFAAFKPCMEINQIVFGPGAEYQALLRDARARLVHTPGEDLLMRLAEGTLHVPVPKRLEQGIGPRSLMAFARTVDALTGSNRMSVCTSYIAGYLSE
jgi:hypothetical protein